MSYNSTSPELVKDISDLKEITSELKVTTSEILQALNIFAESVDKRFEAVDKRFDAVDKRFDRIESTITTLSTKSQINTLVDVLHANSVISKYEAAQVKKIPA